MSHPSTAALLRRLADAVDTQDWEALSGLLADDTRVRFAHTGEVLDVPAYVALNRDYPGRWHFTTEEIVDGGERAVLRARVSDGQETHAVVVTAGSRDGLLRDVVEVWAEVGVAVPSERRPGLG